MVKLKHKPHLMQAHRALEASKGHSGEFINPAMEFVFVDTWDEQGDGKFGAIKVVEVEAFGKTEKGVWEQVGKDGALQAARARRCGSAG